MVVIIIIIITIMIILLRREASGTRAVLYNEGKRLKKWAFLKRVFFFSKLLVFL